MRKIIIIAAMALAAVWVVPSPLLAYEPPACGDSCGSGGGGTDYGPGCDGIQDTSLSGGMDTFNANPDPTNADYQFGVADIQFSFHVDGGGSWSVTYYYQVTDKDGNILYQGSFTRTYNTSNDNSSHEISDSNAIPAPPEGGQLFLGAYGTSSLGGVSDSRGFIRSYECWPVF